MNVFPKLHYTHDNDASVIIVGIKWYFGGGILAGNGYIAIVVLNFEIGIAWEK